MSRIVVDRIARQLAAAEGYLVLNLPGRALEILEARSDWSTMQYEASFLTGETLRALGRPRDALKHLESATALKPHEVGPALALAWCYKRTHRLAQAIDVLTRVLDRHPLEPILHYNLACYWCLAQNPSKALGSLGLALELDEEMRGLVADEPDFDGLRGNPEFDRLVGPAESIS